MNSVDKKPFSNLKLKDLLQLLIIITIAGLFVFFYVNNYARNQLWQKAYPIRVKIANHQLTCTPNAPTWLSDTIKNQTTNGNAPANQIAYIDQQGTLHHCENGYIGDYPLISDPITADTRFRYASVTKLWTADAIFDLIKQNKLTLDTKLAYVLPQINNPTDPRVNDITIAMLLSHRAGFDRYTAVGANDMFNIGENICPNHLEKMNQIQLNFDPDSRTSYSNLGYCLLGEVVATLYQKPYTQVISERYQFANTSLQFIGNQKLADEVSYNYVETGLTGVADIYTEFDYKSLASAAGLSGSAVDLAKQVHTMLKKPQPNITATNPAHPCHTTLNDKTECYGYGMIPYQKDNKTVYFRDGALLGLTSLVTVDDKGQVIALLSNGRASEPNAGRELKLAMYEHLKQAK